MLHTKFQGHRPFGSREEDCFKVFTIYVHGDHFGHVTGTIRTNCRLPIKWRLLPKFGFIQSSGFSGEDVLIC